MKLKDLTESLCQMEASRITGILERLNDTMKSALITGDDRATPLPVASVARLLLFYAMAISDKKKSEGGKSSTNTGQWTAVKNEINGFAETLPKPLQEICCRTYTDDQVSQFATLASRKKGAHAVNFYSTLVLYLADLHDKGGFDAEFLRLVVPKEDRKLLSKISENLQHYIERGSASGTSEVLFEAAVRFDVRQVLNLRLTNFIDYYKSGEKGSAHLVLYRPMKSDPKKLMKTFLAISPPRDLGDGGANNSVFNHFYKAPNERREDNLRFSSGKVLPLDQGVYLVGGQRRWSPENIEGRQPFSSLKVMAVDWIDIENCHSLLSVVVMSTNYKGKIFISRAAARITPFVHHSDANLCSVSLSELGNDLLADAKIEKQFLSESEPNKNGYVWAGSNADRFMINLEADDIDKASRFIINNTNNNPRGNTGWDVGDGYVRGPDESQEKLTNAKLQTAIENILQNNSKDAYRNNADEVYDLWLSTRFGPLGSDAES